MKSGFRGPIYCTSATHELCKLLLPDSGHLQEEDAAYANRHGFSKHAPALPLYTEEDAEHCLHQFRPVGVDRPIALEGGLEAELAEDSVNVSAVFGVGGMVDGQNYDHAARKLFVFGSVEIALWYGVVLNQVDKLICQRFQKSPSPVATYGLLKFSIK